MGRQRKTIRNKRKIGIDNYQNTYSQNNDSTKKITKGLSREIKLTIFSIFAVTITMISSAYAIFSSVQKSENYNTITVGTLKIDFNDTEDGLGNIIKLNGAYPESDNDGQKEEPYTFKITNSGNVSANYKVKILDDTDMIESDNCQDNLLDKTKIKLSINGGEPITLSDKEANSYEIANGILTPNNSRTYKIRIWITDQAGNEVLGKHYHGKIVVEGENTKGTVMCKRATVLHKENCENADYTSYFCQADGYSIGSEIEYGSLGTKGTLSSGDAFDCDVNGDGTYDPDTERFYYVSDVTTGITTDSNTAVLIYYNNVSGGTPSNSTSYAYDESNENWHGPQTAIKQLPKKDQWKTTLTNTKRQITTHTNTTLTTGGNLLEFSYEGYAARFLTLQEMKVGCGSDIPTYKTGELSNKCKYLLENTKYANSARTYGEWLENPHTDNPDQAWSVYVDSRTLFVINTNNVDSFGVRPAIEVQKSNISY